MKTKEEIVRETASFYNFKNRSTTENGTCIYNGPNGTHCAVGRCLTDSAKEKIGPYIHGVPNHLGHNHNKIMCTVGGLEYALKVDNLDDALLEEYRGHDVGFWSKLQNLHDNSFFWDEEGISEAGKHCVKTEFNVDL